MGVPWEAILPFALIYGAINGGTQVVAITHRFFNNGKNPRVSIDAWDQLMIDRDQYIMGDYNVQKAPFGEKR